MLGVTLRCFLRRKSSRRCSFSVSSSSPFSTTCCSRSFAPFSLHPPCFLNTCSIFSSSRFSASFTIDRCLSTRASSSESDDTEDFQGDLLSDEVDNDGHETEEWEEEEEAEAEVGDGGDGGGVVLQGVSWGDHALSIARDVLLQFGNEIQLFAFKTTPRGYIYVRIDKLSHKFGCPSMKEVQIYNQEYKKRLDEAGALGVIPNNLAVEVSSPGAERLLKVPDELPRFKDMPMRLSYVEDGESKPNHQEKTGVFFLDLIDNESEECVWKLADVKENRDPQSKGRLLNRKQKDWRLRLSFANCRKQDEIELIDKADEDEEHSMMEMEGRV